MPLTQAEKRTWRAVRELLRMGFLQKRRNPCPGNGNSVRHTLRWRRSRWCERDPRHDRWTDPGPPSIDTDAFPVAR